jgi:hypothetical protein
MKRALPALLLTGSLATGSLAISNIAFAEGEHTPLFGASVIGTHTPDQPELAGVQLEVAFWRGRIGAAIEGSQQWGIVVDRDQKTAVTAIGASVRLLMYRAMVPSLLDSRDDVELGIELHGIVERAWWQEANHDPAPIRYGAGLTIRLRGGSDDLYSNLIAESRLFLRVMAARYDRSEIAARDMTMFPGGEREREIGVVIGLGAAWGGGQRPYVDRFRPRPLDTFVDAHLIR